MSDHFLPLILHKCAHAFVMGLVTVLRINHHIQIHVQK